MMHDYNIIIKGIQEINSPDYQVARNALWGLTKATDDEISALQLI